MSKVSRRPGREEMKERDRKNKKARQLLRRQRREQGLTPPPTATISNHKSQYKDADEERQARFAATTEHMRVIRAKLPTLLEKFANIKDPRNPKKTKHKLTAVLIYGTLASLFHMASRREANREMTRPIFIENLKLLVPELESIPHNDTLNRLLAGIKVEEIQTIHLDLIRCFNRKKKFRRYMIRKAYPVAVDGSQKFTRNHLWSAEALQRKVGKGDDATLQYYVYILEANLGFHNGMTIPLLSEVLEYTKGDTEEETENNKQDCEQRAFKRLAERLKREFPKLRVIILADGLYPTGPMMALCGEKNWDYMFVLQDKSLKTVWQEYEALKTLQPKNHREQVWRGRKQCYRWVNGIIYEYGPNGRKKLKVNLIVCVETWQVWDKDSGEFVTKCSRHAWISRSALNKNNIHERCNLGARHRWSGIEINFLVEKHQGYQYKHCFSYNWNSMKGYHYLMRMAHMFNVLAQNSKHLVGFVGEVGKRGLIKFVVATISLLSLDPEKVSERLAAPFQLCLVT